MARFSPLALVLVGAALGGASAGCSATLESRVSQPNPLALPPEEASYESKHVHIRVKDMEVPRTFRMYNSAWFSVVSRDRLRFHVVLVHKWEEFADVRNYEVRLEDDRGRVYYPETKEKGKNRFTAKVWDYERRTAITNQFGDVVGTRLDGHRQRVPLDKVDLFKGQGDVTFHADDIIDPRVKRLTLVVARKDGVEYRFTWNLYDPREKDVPEDTRPPGRDDDPEEGHVSPFSGPSGGTPTGGPAPIGR